MNYQLTNSTAILRLKDQALIPADPANSDYAAYLQWVDEGNEPLPYVAPPPVVPDAVTMRQARRALLGAGLLSQVNAAIASLPSPQKEAAAIDWEYAQEVERHNGLVPAMAQALGMTDAQLDALFIVADSL